MYKELFNNAQKVNSRICKVGSVDKEKELCALQILEGFRSVLV